MVGQVRRCRSTGFDIGQDGSITAQYHYGSLRRRSTVIAGGRLTGSAGGSRALHPGRPSRCRCRRVGGRASAIAEPTTWVQIEGLRRLSALPARPPASLVPARRRRRMELSANRSAPRRCVGVRSTDNALIAGTSRSPQVAQSIMAALATVTS